MKFDVHFLVTTYCYAVISSLRRLYWIQEIFSKTNFVTDLFRKTSRRTEINIFPTEGSKEDEFLIAILNTTFQF